MRTVGHEGEIMKKIFILAACAALCSPTFASLKDAAKVFESGKWTVLRSIDKMTDKVNCTGINGGDYGKQLGMGGLYISVKGGIEGVTMRFDDAPARPLRLASKMEKDVRALIIEALEFQSVLSSKRLRLQVNTLVSGLQEFDIDLTGISEAFENIEQDCPIPETVPVAAVTLPAAAVKAEPVPLCSAELIGKMQKAGITKNQVTQVCGSR
jgi:hypothetical protein